MLEEIKNVGEKAEKIKKIIYSDFKPEDMPPQEELDERGNPTN